ncbi:MAG: NAD(P)/FAD-dependent oxidoreductase [Bacteroidota bacterium]
MINKYDVAIIGAGPSGCACALALHRSGLRVVLIDKDFFPRDKICGDAIPALAFKAMDRIKPEWGLAMRQFADHAGIYTSKVFAPNGKTIKLDWVLHAYNSKRLHFDNFLMQLVRAETETTILENKRLQKITVDMDHVCCQFQDGSFLKTAIVVGCDGANSVVKRQLGKLEPLDKHSSAAVRAYFSGVDGVKPGVNEFHYFNELLPGYFWIFPLDNGWTNVGFGISQSKHRKNKKPINLRDSLHTIITTSPSIAPRFKNAKLLEDIKGFALPFWTQKRAISGERFMLCGDAASLIDPLQGHGIDKSMWSGLFAAEQAVKCFNTTDFTADCMLQYDTQLYNKIGEELARSSFIMRLLLRFPWLINLSVWVGQNQTLTNWIARKLKI